MNKHCLLITSRRALGAMPLAVALLMGTSPVLAGDTVKPPKTVSTSPTATTTSVVQTVVAGTVAGSAENVLFEKAPVQIGSTLVPATATTGKQLTLDVAAVKVAGVGLTTKFKYVSNWQTQVTVPFANTVQLKLLFTFGLDKAPMVEDETGLLTLTLTVDDKGVITSATGSLGSVPVAEPVATQ